MSQVVMLHWDADNRWVSENDTHINTESRSEWTRTSESEQYCQLQLGSPSAVVLVQVKHAG